MKAISVVTLVMLAILAKPSAAEEPADPIPVDFDPRVELVSVIFRLAGNTEYNRAAASPYVKAVDERFADYRDHEAVRLAKKLRAERSISYDAVVSLAIHLGSAPEFRAPTFDPRPPLLEKRWSAGDAAAFARAAQRFARDSGFHGFLTHRSPLLIRSAQRLRLVVRKSSLVPWLHAFSGEAAHAEIFVVPSILVGPHCYGVRRLAADGRKQAVAVLGAWTFDATGTPTYDRTILPLVAHEILHSFVNPFVDRHAARLDPLGKEIHEANRAAMDRQAYTSGRIVLYETVVRAAVVRFVRDEFGEDGARAEAERQRQQGFPWVAGLADLLATYEKDRESFVDLDAFADAIAAHLATVAERLRWGPINAVFRYRTADDMLLVGPAPGPEASPAARLADYVRFAHGRFFAAAPLRAPADVTAEQRKGRALVLYGSPASNPVLADVLKRWDVEVGADRIRIGKKTFEGKSLVLITTRPNPDDPTRPVLVYTAAEDAWLVGVNDFRHGLTDFVIGRRRADGWPEIVARGDYRKSGDGRWVVE